MDAAQASQRAHADLSGLCAPASSQNCFETPRLVSRSVGFCDKDNSQLRASWQTTAGRQAAVSHLAAAEANHVRFQRAVYDAARVQPLQKCQLTHRSEVSRDECEETPVARGTSVRARRRHTIASPASSTARCVTTRRWASWSASRLAP
jgi:hypothetical protein